MLRMLSPAANAIRFAPSLAGLGNGLATNQARAVIDEAVNNVHSAALVISKQRRTVDIPVYEPIDAKHAILSHPQPLAWVVAIVIEILPLVMLGLLLALWRDEEKQPEAEPMQSSNVRVRASWPFPPNREKEQHP